MATQDRSTGEVLAPPKRTCRRSWALSVRELARLGSEERTLAQAIASLNGGGPCSSAASPGKRGARSRAGRSQGERRTVPKASATSRSSSRRRRPRTALRSTADRVSELQGLLAEGPKSKVAIAAALKLSPARVQQLLAELGSSVSSQPDPGQGRAKLWSLKGSANGASASGRQAAK